MSTLIEVTSLNKSFGDKHALKDVSFSLDSGSPVALVGPNGAGKTTLFSILCGYLLPDSGELSLFGKAGFGAHCFGKLAALPQDAQLDPRFSILKQLSFYGQLQGLSQSHAIKEAHRVLELVELKEAMTEKPQALSHGMRKRACIAQALIGEPELVMLDEATAGLDPKHAKDIRQLVAEISSEATFVLSSHDLAELDRLCERVYYLEQGVMSEFDANAKLQSQFFTLRLKDQLQGFESRMNQLAGVKTVSLIQDREYLIEVDEEQAQFDIQLLTYLAQQKIIYKQLINGKTLENQLFND